MSIIEKAVDKMMGKAEPPVGKKPPAVSKASQMESVEKQGSPRTQERPIAVRALRARVGRGVEGGVGRQHSWCGL